jgi:ATP-dependent Clp protease ATP-binding subunit ClpC
VDGNLGDSARMALANAERISGDRGHHYISTEHIFLGVLELEDAGIQLRFQALGIDSGDLAAKVVAHIEGSREDNTGRVFFTPRGERVMEIARAEAERLGDGTVEAPHLLIGVLGAGSGVVMRVMGEEGVDPAPLQEALRDMLVSGEWDAGPYVERHDLTQPGTGTPSSTLESLGRDLTELARRGELGPIVGREGELIEVIKVLISGHKANVMLVGEAGVGKTAVVESLAIELADGDVPPELQGCRIRTLEVGGLVAGTQYRGSFEQKMADVVKEAEADPKLILFIDEIHQLIGAGTAEGQQAMDAANILKPALSDRRLRVIGATTEAEYRKFILKDLALDRRFQVVKVDEPTPEDCQVILERLRSKYERYHSVQIMPDALTASVELSVRYIGDRWLPDKAIDVLDKACSDKRLRSYYGYDDFGSLSRKERHALFDGGAKHAPEGPIVVGADDVAQVVSVMTGIPVGKLKEGDRARLLELEDVLGARVLGQSEAISAVAQAVRTHRAGYGNPRRPIGVFLFLGPTGVGKTELAKALAEALFDSEDRMVRVDMAECYDRAFISRLIGAPPGYTGADEGGMLTDAVRKQPYSVVLFDEIEKADRAVHQALLGMMEDGRLTDGMGRTVNFRNTIIIMTSNVGSSRIAGRHPVGFALSGEDDSSTLSRENVRDAVMSELNDCFSAEFLNRFDEAVIFNPLSPELMLGICRKMLARSPVKVAATDAAVEFLATKGYDPALGARPLRRTINDLLVQPIVNKLLRGEISDQSPIVVDVAKDALTFRNGEESAEDEAAQGVEVR